MTGQKQTAFLISPQPWAGFQVSKHHYARALAARGWQVIFIDPPADLGKPGRIEIVPTDSPNISRLRYQTTFPYRIKFHARPLFDLLMRREARRIMRAAGQPTLVWDFDNAYQFRDLRVFGADAALFHLVDDVVEAEMGTKRAGHFFYLHRSFCIHAGGTPLPDHEIGHGLGQIHARAAAGAKDAPRPAGPPQVGFVGNLAATWIDWTAIGEMLSRQPETIFTFWGPLPDVNSTNADLRRIFDHPATRFPGIATPEQIVAESTNIDVWIIPFHASRLLGGPINSHKILEYLSTGRAVVMSWLQAYEESDLVYMLPKSGGSLADLLSRVLSDLGRANSSEMVKRRRAFALNRTYDIWVGQILSLVQPCARHGQTEKSDAA